VILPAPRHHYSFDEYLDLEEIAGVRHEYYEGEIYAMAGGTPEHAAMAAAITAALGRQLGATACRVYSSDLRVRVAATGLATYPDVTVICGPSERDPASPTHVTNPKLVAEVSSPSTADYDRGEKLQHYQQIPSLELVLLFDHTGPRVDLWTRGPEGWRSQRFGAGDNIALQALSCTLAVDEVYAAARGA
jgi:Uma2 family endonuclease